ncbi:MAG: MBL fold metallo-hydrolase [Bacilli bacterium]
MTNFWNWKRFGTKNTTYKFETCGKVIMLDCGGDRLTSSDVSDVDYLFISHEHLDHWQGLIRLITHFKNDCLIYTTQTTKKIIAEIFREKLTYEKFGAQKTNEILNRFNQIQTLYFFNEQKLDNDLKVTLYPSGHTFGSSMIYLVSPDVKLLYTGDMDYVSGKDYRTYYCPDSLEVDIIIMDGTNFLGNDFKTQFINKKAGAVKHINEIKFHVRPEKAVFLAQKLSEIKCLDEHVIIYENDLNWYLRIISEQGYNAYALNKIVLANHFMAPMDIPKTIRLSSRKFSEHNVDWSFGLHISKDDTVNFAHQFKSFPKVYFGHYCLKNYDDYLTSCKPYDFKLLGEGGNEL